MGVVYKAEDTKLGRFVALKFLPEELSNDRQALERFQREAQAASALNHPHICIIHDIDQVDGRHFIAMELLEGETLAARVAKGPLPLDQALRYATEIADALGKAHGKGIVHRDVKPGNVMLIPRTGTKLLDFGLAKRTAAASAGAADAMTQDGPLTAQGMIVGTLDYMAPEQLQGKEADARSDVFALGAVLYEMVTGKRAFSGHTPASICAAILDREPPPVSELQPLASPALDRLIRNCLAKDPDERWQTAADVALELKWIAESGLTAGAGASVAAAAAAGSAKRREGLGWIAAALCFLLAAGTLIWTFRHPQSEAPAVRFSIAAPEKTAFEYGLAVSPDGRRLAFIAGTGGKNQLWVRAMDSLEARPLAGTDGASLPFWSPDGRVIAFFADGKLKKIEASGGAPQTLCDASQDARGGAWSRDGDIVFSRNFTDPLYKVSSAGGPATALTALDASRGETSHRYPNFLPDGRHFLYLAPSSIKGNDAIYIGSLDSKERKPVFAGESNAAYASGYLFFVRERNLMIQPFSAGRLQLTGEARALAPDMAPFGESGPTGYAPFAASEAGVLAYRAGADPKTQLVWFDRSGKQLAAAGPPGFYDDPWLSPDEKRAAVRRNDPQTGSDNIWLMDLASGFLTRFTFHTVLDTAPLWSPDGARIIFASRFRGQMDVYQKVSTGGGNDEVFLESKAFTLPDDWSQDGRYVIFERTDPKTKLDLWVWLLSGDSQPSILLHNPFNETHARFSPDGRWLAYVSDESGKAEVYVQPFPSLAGKWQISTNGGDQPAWRRDGKELFYLAADKRLMAVDVKTGSTFESGVQRALFQTRVRDNTLTGIRNQYAVASNGQRFLVVTPVSESSAAPITVVLNWHSDLKR